MNVFPAWLWVVILGALTMMVWAASDGAKTRRHELELSRVACEAHGGFVYDQACLMPCNERSTR